MTGKCEKCYQEFTKPDEDQRNCIEYVEFDLRMDTTLDEFENGGGSEQFTNNLADSLGVDASLIEITDVREGSVIVTFNVANDGS